MLLEGWLCHALLLARLAPAADGNTGGGALQPVQLAPGIFSLAFSDRFFSANAGWIALESETLLIGAPRGELVPRLLAEAERTTGKPVRRAVLTHARPGEVEAARLLAAKGIRVLAEGAAARRFAEGAGKELETRFDPVGAVRQAGDGKRRIEIYPFGLGGGPGDAAVLAPQEGILFAGELCVNGPRAALQGCDSTRWIGALDRLIALAPRTVVPGFGSAGGAPILERQRRFLIELRRQVGHGIAQGWPLDSIRQAVRMEPEWLVWMPYDAPGPDDIAHLHAELTIPLAPFASPPFEEGGRRPRALAIIGDSPHEPGHIEPELARSLAEAGIEARFTVDGRALTEANLRAVRLLVILRDGYIWPKGPGTAPEVWMTPAQEEAVAAFVKGGGALLALHNATGLYREGGPYLDLLGGTYNGHGPLERFRVRVVDPGHPVAQGAADYEIADEQHTPVVRSAAARIFLRSFSDDGVEAAAGWTLEAGKGKVAYLANGHTREALAHPVYRLLLRNAARWCLGIK